MLWIKGKPGAGKSTLMKHALRRCEEVFHDHLIVAYFFNARGGLLEKTPQGLLQSIVHQLLDKDAMLYEQFVPMYEKQNAYREEGWEWQQSHLKNFILSVVRQRKSKPLLFLVDALDECEDRDVRDVVGFLESLSISAVRAGVTLRICLSSRHYPSVSMKKTLQLVVEMSDDHRQDIATYVGEKLIIQDDDIEAEIRKKADGIFMWVVIVVSLLNKAYDEGKLEAMQELLEKVPNDLEEVFNILFSKDDPNKAETVLMLQWVLLSQRLLKPEELFAAVVGTAHPGSDTIQRRITTSSRGLIDVRKGDRASVQFIHLSVNDFLVRNKRLQTLDQTLGPDPISSSHGRLWAFCWSCIKQLDTTITSRKHMLELNDNHLFLRYAADHIFDHADKALSEDTPGRKAIVQWLGEQSDWFRLWKSFVDATGGYSYSSHDTDGELLYILSLRGKQNLIRVVLEIGADINAQGGHYGTALQADAKRPEKQKTTSNHQKKKTRKQAATSR